VDWIGLVQDKHQWRAFVSMAVFFWVQFHKVSGILEQPHDWRLLKKSSARRSYLLFSGHMV
jgi:hypothetical protein